MTREEAIKGLTSLVEVRRKYVGMQTIKDEIECLDMAIKALSRSENPNKWIPVSERLPEDDEVVLFSTKTDRVFEGRYFDDDTDFQWYAFRDEIFVENNVITAWMPKPQPYKAESEDK